ncbi:neuraminidase-like domain-containing protein [Neptunomonas phycophila]|uniref:Neuraminidase-like domain-containing protein n=1 Tax=Neptunomonas phycophila TaxID=1572645 RepID=A0ABT9EQD0_9GAMM|nr:neuraminidase-like domain-containing protein [Neptunomonas phycophila]MDP2521270.1 neuraminidase-like domain-containing protein [Neptunomonas phycophila]
MKLNIAEIKINDISFHVAMLHQVLAVLGFPVLAKEKKARKAGDSTRSQLKSLAAQFGFTLPASNSLLVDATTGSALEISLKKAGMLASEKTFEVSGAVLDGEDMPIRKQSLLAFDLDLSAVGIYQTVSTLTALVANGGFEFLGEAQTDTKGWYGIQFYTWLYQRAERNKADIVVYAIDGNKIVGRSTLVRAQYYEKSVVRDLDITIQKQETVSEYKRYLSVVQSFLKESDSSLAVIAQSPEQIAFTASELEIDAQHMQLFVETAQFATANAALIDQKHSHALFYGLARQGVTINWQALFIVHADQLQTLIKTAVQNKQIDAPSNQVLKDFLAGVSNGAVDAIVTDGDPSNPASLGAVLKYVPFNQKQKKAFAQALHSFKGDDASLFWGEHLLQQPEFTNKPKEVEKLLFTHQLSVMSEHNGSLIKVLQAAPHIKAVDDLVKLTDKQWDSLIEKSEVPESILGKTKKQRQTNYAKAVKANLDQAFPSLRAAQLVRDGEVKVEGANTAKQIDTFLTTNKAFNLNTSKIHDFDEAIKAVAKEDFTLVRSELMTLQRLNQVSVVPEHINVLKSNQLLSSYAIQNIPKKVFIKQYSALLGGEEHATMIHQMAARNTQAAEIHLMQLSDYASADTPNSIIPSKVKPEINRLIEERTNGAETNEVNYSRLFGSPDICECEQCQSIYGPAAYYVDILRFLSVSGSKLPNTSALDILLKRRPDLVHLPLNCENTHTLIPYVDLANEVMEANAVLSREELNDYQGFDTGSATAEELRAKPQHVRESAYRLLSDEEEGHRAIYPSTLPYHQPLDALRAYYEQLGLSRRAVLSAVNANASETAQYAITAESIGLSEAEYQILTARSFNNVRDTSTVYGFYGAGTASQLKQLSTDIPELLRRMDLQYTDLIALVKTHFLNPHRPLLGVFQRLISEVETQTTLMRDWLDIAELIGDDDIYRMEGGEAGHIDSTLTNTISREDAQTLIANFNGNYRDQNIVEQVTIWARSHLADFNSIVTLYAPDASCNLANTRLSTMNQLYVESGTPSVSGTATFWKKLHRFIRLQRQLGLTVVETDTLLTALSESNITHRTLAKVDAAMQLVRLVGMPIIELAVSWGDIQTSGTDSLYERLFLNKAALPIDPDFAANASGEYLKTAIVIAEKASLIQGAYGITEMEFNAILAAENFTEHANSLSVLSVIFRYSSLAKRLEVSVADLISFIELSGVYPFSKLTVTAGATSYQAVNPAKTLAFVEQFFTVKDAGLSISQLAYLLKGVTNGANPASGLTKTKVLQSLNTICAEVKQLSAAPIDQDILASLLQNTANVLDLSPQLVNQLVVGKEATITAISGGLITFVNDTDVLDETPLPDSLINAYQTLLTGLDRATLCINTLNLDANEVAYLVANSTDFDGLNFDAMTLQQLLRLDAYVRLRVLTSHEEQTVTLIDLFALVNTSDATFAQALPLLTILTSVSEHDLRFIIEYHFSFTDADIKVFNNEIILTQLVTITQLIKQTGLSAEKVIAWGNTEASYEQLSEQSQQLQQAVKAKYGNEKWLTVAGKISDQLREHQQQALVAYLLQKPAIKQAGVKDADGLFEHLLIDVQMTSCMETSRVVQASAAVQMFITRSLLNIEQQVSPSDIDTDRWQWMKNYRVWEANRKIFLYPENWLEPEWRNNKSEFFKELESYLTQNDISDRNVEAALRAYVYSVDEVGNLEICGLYKEDLKEDYKLHVFGRTNATPYKYYYRTLNKFKKWSAWEEISAGIKSVEDGENSGVHLVPVVWKNRVLLFWPEFIKKQVPPPVPRTVDAKTTVTLREATEVWEIRLAWSEYVDGSWTPKNLTKGSLTWPKYESITEADILITAHVDDINRGHNLQVMLMPSRNYHRNFGLVDRRQWIVQQITFSNIRTEPVFKYDNSRWRSSDFVIPFVDSNYQNKFSKRIGEALFRSQYETFLQNESKHAVLQNSTLWPNPDYKIEKIYPNISSEDFHAPFFFSSDNETYFVERKKTPIVTKRNFLGQLITSGGWTVMEFNTFHHPKSGEYVERLNRGGIVGLMESDTTLPDDVGINFVDSYDPNFNWGLVNPRPVNFGDKTYYRNNVCFDVLGANSLYNWELFFHAPLYVATRLMKNGKHEEAMKWFHYIFDPTNDKQDETEGGTELARVWQVLPFKKEAKTSLEQWFKDTLSGGVSTDPIIDEWRDNPFDPHLVAGNRPLAYMKHVLMKYVENLVAWGDAKFKQFTRENVYEALQLYVIAGHILGPKPQRIPKRGNLKAETFDSLRGKWDAFGNALVELENLFPYSGPVSNSEVSTGSSILGVGERFYFCIPANEKLIKYWETVEDRLFKIRHCQDINGTARRLALFAPPIAPSLLVQANSQGLNLDEVLAGLNAPAPIYRFPYLIQKANEFCNDVKSLGAAILSAIEKKDAESLSQLRSSQEIALQESITNIREKQIKEAQVAIESLEKSRASAVERITTYTKRLGVEDFTVPALSGLSDDISLESALPKDTLIDEVPSEAENQAVSKGDSNVNIIHQEKRQIELSQKAQNFTVAAGGAEILAGVAGMIPNAQADGKPFGVGASIIFGGSQLGAAANAIARGLRLAGQLQSDAASKSATIASYIRREQDWALQAKLAAKEIIQIDKQITSAQIREQSARKELDNHKKQIENAKEVEQFLQNKFSGYELYNWMREQLIFIYKQSYDLCYELISQAEQAYSHELGTIPNFLQGGGYWDNNKLGLLAGEKLQLTLRQMESSYIKENKRKFELTKSISLARLNPAALFDFKAGGRCEFDIPNWLFDMDFPGHGYRRIKNARLTIPAVTGPYTTLAAELTHGSGAKIATSSGQNDSGLFELNFRDERFLPFEGLDVKSSWALELPGVQQFDRETVSDVIVHLSYTAVPAVDAPPVDTRGELEDNQGVLHSVISLRNQFPSQWSELLSSGATTIEIQQQHLPYGASRVSSIEGYSTDLNGVGSTKDVDIPVGSGPWQVNLSVNDGHALKDIHLFIAGTVD